MGKSILILFSFLISMSSNAWAVHGKRYLHPILAVINSGHSYPTYRITLKDVDQFFTNHERGPNEGCLILQKLNPEQEFAKKALENRTFYQMLHDKQFPKHNSHVRKKTYKLNNGTEFIKFVQAPYIHHHGHTHSCDLPHLELIEQFRGPSVKTKSHHHRFTYVILPNGTMYFSEGGRSLTKDLASKHKILAGCAEEIIYAGEFYFYNYKKETYLVIDNGSGTYRPTTDHNALLRLKGLLEYNFPQLKVISKHYESDLETSHFR